MQCSRLSHYYTASPPYTPTEVVFEKTQITCFSTTTLAQQPILLLA